MLKIKHLLADLFQGLLIIATLSVAAIVFVLALCQFVRFVEN